MTKPELILLIPHYNNVNGLLNSLRSIKENDAVDILIVDDGSDVKPRYDELIATYKNGTVFLEVLPKNLGIEFALNHGLKKIEILQYEFIGRLDCGDLCHKNRFTIQLNHLKNHPDIMLLGTQVNFVSTNNKLLYKSQLPISHKNISKAFYKNCVIIHPTVVFRTSVVELVGFYPTNYKAAEDYAYFFKILKKHRVENLERVLLDVVIDEKGISVKNKRRQIKSKLNIIEDNFYFGITPIYGILRNLILLIVPFKLLMFVKRKVFNK